MTISVACPRCQKRFAAPAQYAGRTSRCTACGTPFAIPGAVSNITTRPSPVAAPALQPGRSRPGRSDSRKPLLLWGAAGAVVFVVLAGVTFAAWRIAAPRKATEVGDQSADSKQAPVGITHYLPDETDVVLSINVESFVSGRTSENILKRLQERKGSSDQAQASYAKQVAEWQKNLQSEIKPGLGLSWSDIRSVALGGPSTRKEGIWVIKTCKPVTAKAIGDSFKLTLTSSKIGRFTVYDAKREASPPQPGFHFGLADGPLVFCLPDEYTIVGADKIDVLQAVLRRDGPPRVTPESDALFKRAAFGKTFTLAVNAREYQKQQAQKPKEPSKPGTTNIDLGQMLPPEWQPLTRSKALLLEVDTGSGLDLSCELLCQDANDAASLRRVLDGGLAVLGERCKQNIEAAKGQPEEPGLQAAQTLLQRIKVGGSEDRVTAALAVEEDLLVTLIESSAKSIPPLMIPPSRP
jgi:hypothetical protein